MRKSLMALVMSGFVLSAAAAKASTDDSSAPVNINTATAAQLSTLKGVGPKRADAIVEFRKEHGNFKSLDELTGVKGVSSKILDRWEKNNPDRIKLK